MGKNTDKLYITHSEWASDFGGAKAAKAVLNKGLGVEFKRLPFSCCALSLQPFEHPMCTVEGIVFDLMNILPWIKKHGTNPVTGTPLQAGALIKLHFHKSKDSDEYHCPITFKIFNDHTHIVAIKTTGQVYSYEAVERLNIKAKNWTDLMTGEPFKKKDIITLQDPSNTTQRNINEFHYVKHELESKEQQDQDSSHYINAKGSTERVLSEIKSTDQPDMKEKAQEPENKVDLTKVKITPSFIHKSKMGNYTAANFSSGAAAMSFTSTSVSVKTQNRAILYSEEDYMFKNMPKKARGYLQMKTNLGDLNFELYCTEAPRACYNFIMLAKSGYYKNVGFHRSIRNFMIQGGDPTGTGIGGDSIWKKDFADEFKSSLSHDQRGILSMANKGSNTNGAQFFITYKECKQLDFKHTIFGKVVGGIEILNKMEAIPTDSQDKPIHSIFMKDIVVFVNPFEEFKKNLEAKLEREKKFKEKEQEEMQERYRLAQEKRSGTSITATASGVGKYLDMAKLASSTTKRDVDALESLDAAASLHYEVEKKKKKKGFGDFSNW